MSWAVGYDVTWHRDIGYGVPATCDHPDCAASIDRGISYVCGGRPYGGEAGCGLYFCDYHRGYNDVDGCLVEQCERCMEGKPPFGPKSDTDKWTNHKMTDPSWEQWRNEA